MGTRSLGPIQPVIYCLPARNDLYTSLIPAILPAHISAFAPSGPSNNGITLVMMTNYGSKDGTAPIGYLGAYNRIGH